MAEPRVLLLSKRQLRIADLRVDELLRCATEFHEDEVPPDLTWLPLLAELHRTQLASVVQVIVGSAGRPDMKVVTTGSDDWLIEFESDSSAEKWRRLLVGVLPQTAYVVFLAPGDATADSLGVDVATGVLLSEASARAGAGADDDGAAGSGFADEQV